MMRDPPKCPVCGLPVDEQFDIYDVPNDLYLHWDCEPKRPDRE